MGDATVDSDFALSGASFAETDYALQDVGTFVVFEEERSS